MTAYVLIDVSHKQEFIFKSNQLKDNLNYSAIIKVVTEELPQQEEQIFPVTLSNYLASNYADKFDFKYSGGGNSIIEFHCQKLAKEFVQNYSLEVIKAYPDLELYMSTVAKPDGVEYNFKDLRKELGSKLDRIKDKRKARFKRWTYGIEKINQVGKAEEIEGGQPSSSQYEQARELISDRLKEEVVKEEKVKGRITFTNKIQDYKKNENKKSYIGVISIDGNKMGEMVGKLTSFEKLEKFSQTIDSIYLKAVAKALISHAEREPLYVTPIVLAGDDICLIVQAEYALTITKEIIESIQNFDNDSDETVGLIRDVLGTDHTLTACGGVAIVKVTYPFFDAVKKAESLCKNAKGLLYRSGQDKQSIQSASYIDWEIVQGQVIKEDDYEKYVKNRNEKSIFHMKPLRIDQAVPYQDGNFSYQVFYDLIQQLKNNGNISNSTLEQIKKHVYYGWSEYQLFFKEKQIESAEIIASIVEELFKECSVNTCHGAIYDSKEDTYIYILNDVLEALPFILLKEEE